MPSFLRTRLSIHMFLTYATWGAWAPVLAKHLQNIGFTPVQIGALYGTGALATMVSPLVAGEIADRWFPTERFLAVSYLVTGGLFLAAPWVVEFHALWTLAFVAMLFYMPTLALGNSMSFHHLSDPRKDFPVVRVWGTIGWIAGGWILSAWMNVAIARNLPGQGLRVCLALAGAISVLNALYSLTLPHTPPKHDAASKPAIGKTLAMLRDPSFAVLSAGAFLLMVFATSYFTRAPSFFPTVGIRDQDLALVMSVGQIAEILTVLILPAVYLGLGARRTLLLGLAAWTLRFGLYAVGHPKWLVIGAQALHGACFAFVLAAASIYVERICAPDIRASVQNLLSFFYYGVEMFAGSWVSGAVSEHFTAGGVPDWRMIWAVPAAGCAGVFLLFLVGFHAKDVGTETEKR